MKVKYKANREEYMRQQGLLNTESLEQLAGDGDYCCPTYVHCFHSVVS